MLERIIYSTPGKACLLAVVLIALSADAQSLRSVTDEVCVRGDCFNGFGTLQLNSRFGKGQYLGDFTDGEFNGYGRLEIPISWTSKEIYVGNWVAGERSGRGTHWNGKGNLYIGEWKDNRRHGRGSYFYNLAEWRENRHTEFWLQDNTENYTGEFVNDHFQGQGTYRWADGKRYVGGFFAGEKHGHGTFYYDVTGTARRQFWEYGEFIR